jgi:hypothetical protein
LKRGGRFGEFDVFLTGLILTEFSSFNFEDIHMLPPPIIVFDSVAFSYTGKKEEYLYKKVSFGIE